MKKDRDILFAVDKFRVVAIFVFNGLLLVLGIVLCLLAKEQNVFICGLVSISFFVLLMAFVLLGAIKRVIFAKLDKDYIQLTTLYNKTKKKEKWSDLKSVKFNELLADSKAPGDRFILLFFNLADCDLDEDSYTIIEQTPHVVTIIDTLKNRTILRKFVPEQFKKYFDKEMMFRTVYIRGNFIRAYISIILMFVIPVVDTIFILEVLKKYNLIGDTLMYFLLLLQFILPIPICLIGIFTPIRLDVNRKKIVKREAMGTYSAVGEMNWSDIKKVTKFRTKWKSEYIVMSFSDEDVEGKTLKELINSPRVMVAKLNKRNRKILLKYLPEQFKERVLLPS